MSISISGARKDWVEHKIESKLPKAVLRAQFLGHRLLVIDALPERKYGSIIIPTTGQERGAEGYIISLGGDAGYGKDRGGMYESFWPSIPLDQQYEAHLDMLGRHIGYRYHAGFSIQMSVAEDCYSGPIKVLHAKDILFFHNDEEDFKIED